MTEWLVLSLLGLIVFVTSLGGAFITLSKQAFPSGDQQLATKCELEKIEENWKKREEGPPDGYFMIGDIKQPCGIVEEREIEIKIRYTLPLGSWSYDRFNRNLYKAEKWIPRKEFHRYYTPQEISDILREKKLVK